MVSTQAIEQLYKIAPGWDKYMLENLYIAWAKDKDTARNEDARFLGWVKSYTKEKPTLIGAMGRFLKYCFEQNWAVKPPELMLWTAFPPN